jgi:hypothetical protein
VRHCIVGSCSDPLQLLLLSSCIVLRSGCSAATTSSMVKPLTQDRRQPLASYRTLDTGIEEGSPPNIRNGDQDVPSA